MESSQPTSTIKTMHLPHRPSGYNCRLVRIAFRVFLLLLGLYLLFFRQPAFNLHEEAAYNTALSRPNLVPAVEPVEAWNPTRKRSELRIAKATVLYNRGIGSSVTAESLLARHEEHNRRHGYTMHVLHTPLVRGAINKLLHLQSLIIASLQQPIERQTEWLLYFDPDILLQDVNIPLHIFLPPTTIPAIETFKTLSLIAAKPDGESISTAVFFLRVSSMSLRILMEAMVELYHGAWSTESDGDIVGVALQSILERDADRDKAVYQDASWYNDTTSVFRQPWFETLAQCTVYRAGGGRDVDGEISDRGKQEEKRIPDLDAVNSFWNSIAEARMVVNEAKDRGHTAEKGEWRDVVRGVRECVELKTWDVAEVDRRVKVLKEGLDI